MGFKCGIVGLPNVGKSTLFNALTSSFSAEAANYPFCTIEPNMGAVEVPDFRLVQLAELVNAKKIIPTFIEFVDIAGLVKGASRGEGLGNKFLGHIREVDAIAYVVRCFEDSDVTHIANRIDPVEDAEVIQMELILSDLESLNSRLPKIEKKARIDKKHRKELDLVKSLIETLEAGKLIQNVVDSENIEEIRSLNLLTDKPYFFISNVAENQINGGNCYTQAIDRLAKVRSVSNIIVSAQLECEMANVKNENERLELMKSFEMQESGLNKIIRQGYSMLELITFFTVGPQEARAWTVKVGTKAPDAAAVIHSDFKDGFIRAEVIKYADYLECGGEVKAKELGKMHVEGKDYVVQDGDIMHFRFNKQ